MDSQEEVLICGCADDVPCYQEPPVEYGCVAEEIGAEDLERDDAQNDIFG